MSKAPNILNLDEFVTEKYIKLKDKDRRVRGVTVAEFINTTNFENSLEKKSPSEQTKLLIARILDFVEDTTEQELKELEVDQLMALLAFIRGENPIDAVAAAQQAVEEAEEGNAKAGKNTK